MNSLEVICFWSKYLFVVSVPLRNNATSSFDRVGGFEHKDQNVISVMLFACLPLVIRLEKTVPVHEWKTRLVSIFMHANNFLFLTGNAKLED